MALRSLLTAAERSQVLAIPTNEEDLGARYTLSEADMSLIRQRRGDANRLGFAVQAWTGYGDREQTRQDHAKELPIYLGMSAFGIEDFRRLVKYVSDVAAQTGVAPLWPWAPAKQAEDADAAAAQCWRGERRVNLQVIAAERRIVSSNRSSITT